MLRVRAFALPVDFEKRIGHSLKEIDLGVLKISKRKRDFI